MCIRDSFNFASNEVWEGTISVQDKLRVEWKSLRTMLEPRHKHVSLIIMDTLWCIGGQGKNSTEFYSFKHKVWKKGPVLPFTLSGAQCVHSKKTNQQFIIGGSRNGKLSSKIYTFDPRKGINEVAGKIDIPCRSDIAVLL